MLTTESIVYRLQTRAIYGMNHNYNCVVLLRRIYDNVRSNPQFDIYNSHYSHATLQELIVSKERELERMYGVRYGEALRVDANYIASNEYATLFDGIVGIPDIDAKLLVAARHSLERNSGTCFESITFIDVISGESISVDGHLQGGVSYTQEVRDFIDARKNGNPRIAAIHNHPNGTPPSADDLSKMSENNYLIGVVVGHNGQVYTYEYHGPLLDETLRDSIADDVARLCQYGYDIDRAYTEVFLNYGLSYELR